MTDRNRTIELNSRLLGLYLRLAGKGETDLGAVITELVAIKDDLTAADQPDTLATFGRYTQLISLNLAAADRPRLEAALAPVMDPPAPSSIALPPPFEGQSQTLSAFRPESKPGISVVTCSMNRTENLLRAMPSWLANAEITEIIVVDWSSKVPVEEELRKAKLTDPRIRILRVEGEPRWILSYAFNAGFRVAACDTILKVDADIVLSPDFFARNHVTEGSFIAGNWRTAAEGQAHVNGFFFLPRSALVAVCGFNEHITTYGWDDDDIYDRMTLAGIRRRDVAPDTIFHLDHDDEDRIGPLDQNAKTRTVQQDLTSGTKFLIRRNRYISMVMPSWQQDSILLPLRITATKGNVMTVTREGWEPARVPATVFQAGTAHALAELLSWKLGRRVLDLDADRMALLLNRPNAEVSRIDLEVALVAPDRVIRGHGHYMVLELAAPLVSKTPPAVEERCAHLLDAARKLGLTPVLRSGLTELPALAPAMLRALPLIPSWETIGDVTSGDVLAMTAAPPHNLHVEVTEAILKSPAVVKHSPRIFIDAQHGLGNRLRAIGSAAAIAAASGREMVVIWEPDHHCDCRFSDLFDYKGAVIEQRFMDQARTRGALVYNYMTAEEGSEKDALISLDTTADIYARSAFVLNSPHSSWTTENAFLKSLTPIEPIRKLVEAVRHPNAISAHVRMEAGAGLDNNTYDRPENWRPEDHEAIHKWRAKSHFSHFMKRIDALIAEGRADTIFLAADLPATYAEFQDRYGDRLAWLPRSLYDRSAEQLHYALADAILLSHASRLLGSTWSSFSELAMRMAKGKIEIEMSGRDF